MLQLVLLFLGGVNNILCILIEHQEYLLLLVSSVSLFSEAVFGCDALWLAVILLAVVTLVLASLFPPTGWTVT